MKVATIAEKGHTGLGSPDELLETYLPLIRYHAEQLVRRTPDCIEWDDLVNAGVLGLLDSASRFDPEREVQFKTFVSYRVRGAMIDYLRAYDWFPRKLRDTAKEIQATLQQLESKHGRPAEEAEVAEALGISLQSYRNRLQNVRGMSILYFDDLPTTGNEDDCLDVLETIAGNPQDEPEAQTAMNEFIDHLAAAVEALPQRERIVLTLYYYEELSMKEIADVFELTESRISQIHCQLVLRLRGLLNLELPENIR